MDIDYKIVSAPSIEHLTEKVRDHLPEWNLIGGAIYCKDSFNHWNQTLYKEEKTEGQSLPPVEIKGLGKH